MRRSKSTARRIPIRSTAAVAVMAAVTCFGTLGCEDGPTQPYAPATPSETGIWNNPNGSQVSPSTKDFSYLQGGTNANVICNGDTLAKVWADMDSQPILPPVSAGGLDMAGPGCTPTDPNCTWPGITIEQAEQVLCQSTNDGDLFGDGELANSWGDSGELIAHYLITTHKIDFLWIQPGYLGVITATGCAGTPSNGHTYTFPVGVQVTKDGQPWTIDWAAPTSPTDWRNEVTSAITCTFAPTLVSTQDCNSTGGCIQGSFGNEAYLALSVFGIGLYIGNQYAAQPTPSIIGAIQMPLAKLTPFAEAAINLKIDNVGPTGSAGLLGTGSAPCTMQFGETYGDFLSQCIQVSTDTTTNTANLNKLLGGIQHDDERFFFNVQGLDFNFGDGRLMPTQVVGDADLPAATDTASEIYVDQNTLGPLVHDYVNNDPTQKKDTHGNGLVNLEAIRIAQQTLNAELSAASAGFTPHFIGDPACSDSAVGGPAAGCTGLEELVTTAPQVLISAATTLPKTIACTANAGGCDATGNLITVPSTVTAAEVAILQNAGVAPGVDITLATTPSALHSQLLGMRPGTPNTAFCPNSADLLDCPTTYQGLTIPTDVARLIAILGAGSKSKLPVDAQDARFFFQSYATALLKYLKAEGAATVAGKDPSQITLADVDMQYVNPYSVFFDSIGAGQFEEVEYIERAWATATAPPLDLVFSADVIHGIMNAYDYSAYLYRGETAIYTAMLDDRDGQTHPIATQDNALLSNMFGSPVLLAGWADHTKDSGAQYTPYYCATHNEPAPCGGQTAPLDANGNILLDGNGKPYLAAYEGAFTGSATDFTIGGGTGQSSPVAVSTVKNTGDTGTGTFENIQEIDVQMPLHVNPYDLTSAGPPGGKTVVSALIPWAPKQPGIGFPVALDGQREQFIETYQMDFSGEQITANVDYDFALSAAGTPTTQILFLAVETTDFLGDIFVCQDTNTGDLLTAKMYTSVSVMLQWIAAHPTAYAACNIIMEYSPYENYLDYLNSQSNGIRLSSTQGGGFGRIVDGTLFDPNLPNHVLSN